MTTTRQINAALKRNNFPLEFVGTREGYHYFTTNETLPYDSHSICTCYVSDLSIDQWMEHAETFMDLISKN